MSKFYLKALLNSTSVFLLFSPVAAQDSLRITVANLSQDVDLLEQSLKTMRLEIEELRRENARIRAQMAAASSKSATSAQITNLSVAIETLRREYGLADTQQKQQILAELNRQISVLAKETQSAINSIAKAAYNHLKSRHLYISPTISLRLVRLMLYAQVIHSVKSLAITALQSKTFKTPIRLLTRRKTFKSEKLYSSPFLNRSCLKYV